MIEKRLGYQNTHPFQVAVYDSFRVNILNALGHLEHLTTYRLFYLFNRALNPYQPMYFINVWFLVLSPPIG